MTMTIKDIEAICEVVMKSYGGSCLCGHSESCSTCDGSEHYLKKRICKAIEEWFDNNIDMGL